MTTYVLQSLHWRGVHLTLHGHQVDPEPDAEPIAFFAVNRDNGKTVRLPEPSVDGDRFTLTYNAMQVDRQYPLTSGSWELFVRPADWQDTSAWTSTGESDDDDDTEAPADGAPEDDDDEESGGPDAEPDLGIPVSISPDFTLPALDYGGLFTSPRYAYSVIPGNTPTTDRFRMVVMYRRIPGPPSTVTVPKWVRNLRKRQARFMDRTFWRIHGGTKKLVRRNGKRILFTSDSRPELSGNLKDIHDRMIERGLDKDFTIYQSFKSSINVKRDLRDRILFPAYLAMADIILLDDYHPVLYKPRFADDVTIIQVWHASGAFKTVGYSRIGKPGGPSPFGAAHKNYTYALVSSPHDIPFYAEAFGLPHDRVIPTGIPRMDAFLDEGSQAVQRAQAYADMPALVGKKVVFFAPTFRGTGPVNAYYDYDKIDLSALYDWCVAEDAMVVFKFHPFVLDTFEVPAEFADRFVDATARREINDILLVADILITDYSTVCFEYSTLGRPMLFFAYDLEDYIATRDFYEPYEDFVPGKIVRTFADVMAALQSGDFEQHKVDAFAHKHFSHLDGGATDRVIDQLILKTEPIERD